MKKNIDRLSGNNYRVAKFSKWCLDITGTIMPNLLSIENYDMPTLSI